MMNREEKNKQNVEQEDNKTMPFGRDNYLWVIIGLAFLLIGFLLMIGGAPTILMSSMMRYSISVV